MRKLYRDGDDEMIYTLSDKLREEGRIEERELLLELFGISKEEYEAKLAEKQKKELKMQNNENI